MKKPRKAIVLPKYVKLVGNRYVYRPYIPISQRLNFNTDKFGYLKPPIKLGHKNDAIHTIYAAYAAAEEQLQHQRQPDYMTLNWLLTEYKKSRLYTELGVETKRRYRECEKILEHRLDINGTEATVGQLRATDVDSTLIRRLLDKRLADYQAKGKAGESQCNNEKALLSSLYRYGTQYIKELAPMKNPCHGVDRFKVKVRDRYVTDDEYLIQYQCAQAYLTYLPIVMELTYLLAARGVEVTDLKIGHSTELGIIVKRRKGSKTTLIKWNERLKAAWDSALALHSNPHPDLHLLKAVRGGSRLTKFGLDNAWQALKEKMHKQGLGEIYFQLHDLKRKGISDAEDDRIAGHVSDTIRANYNVKLRTFDPPK